VTFWIGLDWVLRDNWFGQILFQSAADIIWRRGAQHRYKTVSSMKLPLLKDVWSRKLPANNSNPF